MSVEFKNSRTKENLMKAFAGESQARNRYTFAAQQAHEQKLHVLEEVFRFTAEQERAHGKVFYEFLTELSGENIAIEGTYPIDISDSLEELLGMAEHNENEEHDTVYKGFEEIARQEGFQQVAGAFHMIGKVEKVHADRFAKFRKWMQDNQLFVSDVSTAWMCLNCGYIVDMKEAPEKCPVCGEEQGYFVRVTLAPYSE
ncbi:MAG: rubrerythrin [Lachnospiraceae bacterium]